MNVKPVEVEASRDVDVEVQIVQDLHEWVDSALGYLGCWNPKLATDDCVHMSGSAMPADIACDRVQQGETSKLGERRGGRRRESRGRKQKQRT